MTQIVQSLVSPNPYSCSFSGFGESGSPSTDKPSSVIPTQKAPLNPPFLPAQPAIPPQQPQFIPISYTSRQTLPILPTYQSIQLPEQQFYPAQQPQQTYPETMPTQQAPLNTHFNPQQQSQPNPAPYTTQHPPTNQSYHPQQPQQTWYNPDTMAPYMCAAWPPYHSPQSLVPKETDLSTPAIGNPTQQSQSRQCYPSQLPQTFPTQETYPPVCPTHPQSTLPVWTTSNTPGPSHTSTLPSFCPPTSQPKNFSVSQTSTGPIRAAMPPASVIPLQNIPLPPNPPSTSQAIDFGQTENVPAGNIKQILCSKCGEYIYDTYYRKHFPKCQGGHARKMRK
ncbi:unnamed protein product [Meloidogyne enterolobii]|uniref:Uncharacterized protein n=1 Tax=Meloidogyne enterolobii TaxID=390850 RepID=A0ACB0ZZY2_MELEN